MLMVSTDCSGEKQAMAPTLRMSMNIAQRIRKPMILGTTRARPENRYHDITEMLIIVMFAIPNFGLDAESFRAGLAKAMSRLLEIETGTDAAVTPLPAGKNAIKLIDFLVMVIPPAAAVLATVTSLVNLWLAAKIVGFSGRLKRPWPQLSAMTFPPMVSAALAAAAALSFVDSLVGIMAGVITASLTMAYGVLGFAVLHDVTRGIGSRPFLLGGAYAAVIMFGWPVLVLCLIGLVESAAGLRARLAQRRGPPTTT